MNAARRVVLNTTIHYIQLLINVALGLFTIKIILNALGTIDYGVYSLMGGVIGLLSFISSSLSQTSVRYLSVSLGKKDDSIIRKNFRICFWLHTSMATILVIIMEVSGIFFFGGFLNIPPESLWAAYMVFHCMVLSLFLGVSTSPFGGLLVAHEQFPFMSAIGITNSVLKLLIAIIISTLHSDKLLVYGFLMAGVSVFGTMCYIFFCFQKYSSQLSFSKVSFVEMHGVMGFAGWTLLDVTGSMLNRQGYAVMLNKFFGPVVNTTFALSRQIEGHLYTVSSSVIDTIRPQIMASQGADNPERVFSLSMTAGKIGFVMMSFIAIPLYVMMPDILDLWLTSVPEGTALFSRLLIIACMAEQMTRGLVYANQAIGNIKWFSIIVSGIRTMALPLSVIVLLCGKPAYWAIVIFMICEVTGSLSRVFVLSKIANFNPFPFFYQVLFKVLPPFIISFCICQFLYQPGNDILHMLYVALMTVCLYMCMLYFFGLTEYERRSIISIITFQK